MTRRLALATVCGLAAALVAGCASAGDPQGATAAPLTVAARLPEPVTFTLTNGMEVLLVPDAAVPLVGFEVRIAGGHGAPVALVTGQRSADGVAGVLAELLRRGAGGRDAGAFREAVEVRGGRVWSSASPRSVVVAGDFLAEDAGWMLGLVADVLLRPRLAADEFEKTRRLAIDGIRADKEEPSEVIARYWQQWLRPASPFGAPIGGDEASLATLRHEQVTALWEAISLPERVVLCITGDVDVDATRARIEALFGSGPRGVTTLAGIDVPPPVAGARVLLVDKPDAVQTYFRFGGAGLDWRDPDYAARQVANTVLGGRFTSRLNTALRIESGLSYGARSSFDDERGGLFAVSTYTAVETSREALELAAATYRRFLADGLSEAEFASARTYIQGQYAPDHLETASQAGSLLLDLRELGVPRTEVDRYFEHLDALTREEVNRVIRERFPHDPLAWVVIGPAVDLREIVAPLGDVTEVPLSFPGFGPR